MGLLAPAGTEGTRSDLVLSMPFFRGSLNRKFFFGKGLDTFLQPDPTVALERQSLAGGLLLYLSAYRIGVAFPAHADNVSRPEVRSIGMVLAPVCLSIWPVDTFPG